MLTNVQYTSSELSQPRTSIVLARAVLKFEHVIMTEEQVVGHVQEKRNLAVIFVRDFSVL
jgi:hypothetical protein